nr:transposase [Calderihabitans maritimus]
MYWKPIYSLLELEGIEILVVNAKHIKAVPGRKTDVKDAEWIADFLRHGLLKDSYIPSREQRELRKLVRYRKKLIEERAREINRMQKVLEDANIKLSSVVTILWEHQGGVTVK